VSSASRQLNQINAAAMKIIQNSTTLKDADRHAVLAIGNFDGVHLGHQAVLKQTQLIAKANKKPWCLSPIRGRFSGPVSRFSASPRLTSKHA